MTHEQYAAAAQNLRVQTLKLISRAKSSHLGSNYSIADILTVLYNGILKVDPQNPKWEGRDRFILSKGHACAGLYILLAEKGFFPKEWLDTFYLPGSKLAGHVMSSVPGIELSTGSLGHGLPVATGMALALKRDERSERVICLMSDGELDEGSNWEAFMFAPHHKLDNLTVVIDYNEIQSLTTTHETLNLEPLRQKFEAFNWKVREIDGHNYGQIHDALSSPPLEAGHPTCIIAHTTKGKGVSFMERSVLWHYRSPDDVEYERAHRELTQSTCADVSVNPVIESPQKP